MVSKTTLKQAMSKDSTETRIALKDKHKTKSGYQTKTLKQVHKPGRCTLVVKN